MSSPTLLQQITDRAGRLYSLPSVAVEVLELTSAPQVDTAALKACIENDPALTAKLLKVVNSSLFGLTRKVSDLNQALALLGVKPLKMLVLGFSLPKDLDRALETQALSRFWRHALIKAVACRELAEDIWRKSGDEPFIAGLLQDLGKLVLVQQLGEPFHRFLNQAECDPRPLVDLELETLGFDHTILTARLLDKWGLPATFSRLVAQPFDAHRILQLPVEERWQAQVLHLGELIARLMMRRPGSSLDEILSIGQEYCNLEYPQLRDVIESLEVKVTALGEILALFQPGGPPFCEILAAAHAQLSDLAEGAGAELGRGVMPETYLLAETRRLSDELKSALAGGPKFASSGDGRAVATATAVAPKSIAAPVDAGLPARVQNGLFLARENRQPLSLLLVEVDSFANLVFTRGLERATWLQNLVQQVAADAARDLGGECTLVGEARFAIVAAGCDRRDGADAAREILQGLRERLTRCGESDAGLSLSLGLATITLPPRNFPPSNLITAAERCLCGARTAGGASVTRIEL